MSGKRFEGKNLEEALDNAAGSFGVERFRISYHVVLEKRGFLGGTKRVVIEAEVSGTPLGNQAEGKEEKRSKPKERNRKPDREKPQREKPQREKRPEPARREPAEPSEARAERAAPREDDGGGDERGEKKSRGRGRRRGRRGRRGPSGESGGEDRPQRDEAKVTRPSEPVEVPDQGEQSEDAARVAEWCSEIFRLSGLDLVARTTETDEEISVELFGADVSLIEEGVSDYLDSLQVLANKAFTGRTVERRIEFDAGGFKARREQELRERALELAARVREEGRETTMRAMSPIERRIVHVTLEEEKGVSTESRGRGFHKRVVILPSDDDERTAAAES